MGKKTGNHTDHDTVQTQMSFRLCGPGPATPSGKSILDSIPLEKINMQPSCKKGKYHVINTFTFTNQVTVN